MTSTSTTTTTLRDGYTKRAADVLREIDDGRARLPVDGPASWSRRLGIGAAVVAVAVGAGVLVARSSGDRLAGEEITGGAPGGGVASLLAEARLLRAVDPIAATQLYGEVLDAAPRSSRGAHVQRLAAARSSARNRATRRVTPSAVDGAREKLAQAIDADPSYADPHCFLAFIAAEVDGDVELARTEASTCLELDPPADLRADAEAFLAQLD